MVKDSENTSERAKAKLDRILAVAKKRFDRYGIAKTTMHDIAEDIGFSKASLYYYYKDKETIFMAVIAREQADFISAMDAIIREGNDTETMLLTYVKQRITLFKSLLSPGNFNYDSYMEMRPLFSESFQEFRKKELSIIIKILKSGIERKQIYIDNVKAQAEFIRETFRGLRQVIFSHHTYGDLQEVPPKRYLELEKNAALLIHYFILGVSKPKTSK